MMIIKIKSKNFSSFILLKKNILSSFIKFLLGKKYNKVLIIMDSEIKRIFLSKIKEMLNGIKEMRFVFFILKSKEEKKSIYSYIKIQEILLKKRFNKNSLIVALGGGIITDLSGFVAGTFYRGIPYISIPTTLLAQVDSCIGGKTGINHSNYGKNLIGLYYHPKAVFVDPIFLKSLSDNDYLTGISEIIKYAIIYDNSLFSMLKKEGDKIIRRDLSLLKKIIYICLSIKSSIIKKDEKDNHLRKILNFGHTIGHALEAASSYKLNHGQAISIGMVIEAKIAKEMDLISNEELESIQRLFVFFSLPIDIPKFIRYRKLLFFLSYDKKNKSGKIALCLPKRIGKMKRFNGKYCTFLSKKEIIKYIYGLN